MEVAVVECNREEELDQGPSSSFQVQVFCIQRGGFSPPQGLKPLSKSFDLRNTNGGCYAFFLGDFELGFIVGRLALEHQVTFYTSRNTIESFQYVNVKVKQLDTTTRGRESPSPKPSEPPEEATSQFLRQVEEKYRTTFLLNPMSRAAKKASVLAQMRNVADGVLGSYRSRYPCYSESCPSSEELSERLFDDLRRKGVLVERLGQVEYLVQGVQAQKPSLSKPSVQRLTTSLKLDTLHKYIEKFLLQPGVRAVKEKSARAQLTNLAKGGVIAIRTKYGAHVDIPTEETVSTELFEGLVARRVILLEGLNVQYSDRAIEALANDTQAQEELCEEESSDKPLIQPDIKTAILREALVKYYQKFLTSSATAAKTSKGVKEQIKNFVQGSVTSAAKSNPELYRTLPSVDELTDRLYRILVNRRVIVTVGAGMRYSQEAIEALESEMMEIVLWEEGGVEETATEQRLVANVQRTVLTQCRDLQRLTIGGVLDLAKRSVMASLAFNSGGKSTASVPSLAKEVLFSLLENEELRLSPSAPALQMIKSSLERYSTLEVFVGDAEDDGPGA